MSAPYNGISIQENQPGIIGTNNAPVDPMGSSGSSIGVMGVSLGGEGVHGETHSKTFPGVAGISHGGGAAIYGENKANGSAGFFNGTVDVSGNLIVTGNISASGNLTLRGDIFLTGADLAEHFEIESLEGVEPGTVMVINPSGSLEASNRAYDKRVAGVISGAGTFRPGIILDNRSTEPKRMPIALMGKAFCKVDASSSPIEVGDMLTTSSTLGHAMKATDRDKAFGAVIGKALRAVDTGCGLIPILIALR